MPIEPSDLVWYLSGGAENDDPNDSLGGVMSTTAWTGGTPHDLFDVITAAENEGEVVDYRCVYVVNEHSTLDWQDAFAWFSNIVAGGADIAMGLDPAGVDGTATTIADENTAPGGVSFSAPTNKGAGLDIGTIPAGEHQAIWFRRTATDSGAVSDDGATVMVEGETAG
jgi:hypothetical protein